MFFHFPALFVLYTPFIFCLKFCLFPPTILLRILFSSALIQTISCIIVLVFLFDLCFCFQFQVHHDMTLPLSHYFIYTGHNSYLTGNQLSSDCSDVPIVNALKRGVRVIELDIWPNASKDNVDVLHGR